MSQMMMSDQLEMERCPHCSIAKPTMQRLFGSFQSTAHSGLNKTWWSSYRCTSCGALVLASSSMSAVGLIDKVFPTPKQVSQFIPDPARSYLHQANESQHAPSGAIMLAASAVDAMLKSKGLKSGTLFNRIDKAADDHLITAEMAAWAHEIRLDANEPRHADEIDPLPDLADALKCINFAFALGEFLFVLPARVERGRLRNTSS